MKIKYLLPILLLSVACNTGTDKKGPPVLPKETKPKTTVKVKLLPLGKTTNEFISTTYAAVKQFIANAELLPPEKMPRHAFYAPRNRYRADSLIHWMAGRAKSDEVYIGITMQDISTTKGNNPDHGVMGLGFMPGKACMTSNFRLRNKNNYFKVVVHELGHTTGLPHCPEKTCFMRDAEGGDPTGEEKGFCTKCKKHLVEKGWKL